MTPRKPTSAFAFRLVFFIFGAASTLLPYKALYTGKIEAGKSGAQFDIIRSEEPFSFWTVVIIFSLASAVMFYFAFAKIKLRP